MKYDVSASGVMSKGWQRFFTVFMFAPLLMVRLEYDNDLWFLLNSGRYVLANGIPHTEPFSIHEGLHFVMQQWLSAVVFWVSWNVFGKACLFVLIALVFAAMIMMLHKLCMLVTDGNFLVSFGVTTMTAAFMALFYKSRPQIFTLLILAVMLYALEKYALTKNWKWLIFLPFLSVLLINMHASMWLMMFVLMLPYFVDAFKFKILFIRGEGYAKIPLLIAAVASFVVGFLNPYGFEAMTYILRSYGHAEISTVVGEMLPPNISNTVGIVIFATFLIVILIYCLHRKGQTKLRYALLTLGTAFLALSSVRSYMLFLLGTSFPLAYYLKDITFKEHENETKKDASSPKTRKILVAAICVLLIGCIPLKFVRQDPTGGMAPSSDAVGYLLNNTDPSQVRLYIGYDDGDYAQFMGIKTYIDARAEVFCIENNGKADIMQEYYDMQMGRVNYRDVLTKYPFTHLIVNSGDILYAYLDDDDSYKKIYEKGDYRIYVPAT